MNSNAWLTIVFLALALILPLSALRSRQLSASKIARMIAAWIVIVLAVAFIISQVHPS